MAHFTHKEELKCQSIDEGSACLGKLTVCCGEGMLDFIFA